MNAWPAMVMLQGAEGGGISILIPMALILGIFYFLLIRPQQKAQREHEQMQTGVDKGDEIVTTGGLHGKVMGTTDDVLTVEIAAMKGGERVRVKVNRNRVDTVKKAKGGAES
ncbi:MAG: preprotein translocase subunit YajC [Proteobacteria bacterium]|nr:preprotein translocase subunit YajC [Pseudomonadota bacterium]